MPSLSFIVGVDPILFYPRPRVTNAFIDIIVQNLSANIVYFTESPTGGVENGLQLMPLTVLEIKEYHGAIWFIADGADSDIRINYQEYLMNNKEREV